MALLTLKDIGKIYVSEGNVAVGIRGVNLSFERGEFVAITGKSGSGKSTLLNVISGMDNYEEGEMYIDGKPTSHYMQPDWEYYRQKYISFIFQDYNIIDSFTVLQNVELALMHITDIRERRRRAMQLLERVGLKDFIHSKGSRLSGGQKQRTVIARALAKDSPIILADEPTGNLDSRTGEEIIKLLQDVSRDKLLIMVTHNFEQVENIATRHIRVFDGAIESDQMITPPTPTDKEEVTKVDEQEVPPNKKKLTHVKNGFSLGATIFIAKPKLTAFLCLLLIIGTLSLFFVTSSISDGLNIFKKYYMFGNVEGRVVVASQSGSPITESETGELSQKYGAKSYLKYDQLLDATDDALAIYTKGDNENYFKTDFRFNESYGNDIVGRYPQAVDEVFLYLPISLQPTFGKDSIKITKITTSKTLTLNVVGLKYFYDNTKTAKMLFTEEGFNLATYVYYLNSLSKTINVNVITKGSESTVNSFSMNYIVPSFNLGEGKIYIADSSYSSCISKLTGEYSVDTSMIFSYSRYNSQSQSYDWSSLIVSKDKSSLSAVEPDNLGWVYDGYAESFLGSTFSDVWKVEEYYSVIYVSVDMVEQVASTVLANSYKQASLFFANNRTAHTAASKLQSDGYVAVTSDTTYEPNILVSIINTLSAFFSLFEWVIAVIFIAFFINLCTNKTIEAFKGDMAIMRSMGIPVGTIRASMYIRMALVLVPAFLFLIVASLLIFLSPSLNGLFTFLHAWQYLFIVLGMIIVTLRVTRKQLKKLFDTSVKNSLKGGNAQ